MWFLFLPDFVYNLIPIVGIVTTLIGLTLSGVPLIQRYTIPLLVFGILILIAGAYFKGAQMTQRMYDNKIAELNAKLALAEVESEKINTQIVTQVLTKKEVIKEKGNTIVKYITKEVTKNDDKCSISPQVITAHNSAAKNTSIETDKDLAK